MKTFWRNVPKFSCAIFLGVTLMSAGIALAQPDGRPGDPARGEMFKAKDFDPKGRPDHMPNGRPGEPRQGDMFKGKDFDQKGRPHRRPDGNVGKHGPKEGRPDMERGRHFDDRKDGKRFRKDQPGKDHRQGSDHRPDRERR